MNVCVHGRLGVGLDCTHAWKPFPSIPAAAQLCMAVIPYHDQKSASLPSPFSPLYDVD